MTTVAGLNLKGRIWRFTNPVDDDQGGSVPTGTILYEPVFSRIIRSEKPTLALLEQGLETPEIFTGILSYATFSPTGTFTVLHNDQYEVTEPRISQHYGKRFVIIGIRPTSYDDNRQFLQVSLRRMETAKANSNLLQ
jgi:hypothetical protein